MTGLVRDNGRRGANDMARRSWICDGRRAAIVPCRTYLDLGIESASGSFDEAKISGYRVIQEVCVNSLALPRAVPLGVSSVADTEIVACCRRGDGNAWRSLYYRFAPVVYRFLSAFGVPSGEREDACQEVFVRLYRSLDRFRGEALLSTWIYRIAARYASRAARRRRV